MAFLFLLLTSALAQAVELPHDDSKFGCFTQAEADRYLADFSVDVDSFGGAELCDGTKDTKKLLNDLYLIEKTEFAAPVNHPFIRGFVDRAGYYSWMKGETRGVNRGRDIPYATAYNSGGYFTMQDGWAELSTLGRVGTIIHEARHTAGYRHYGCTFGPYADSGVSGCDSNYNQGGSHAVEMEYYARVVLEAKNLHPVYKSMARLMALGRSNFVFNQQPMQKREALVALARDKVVMLDGAKVTEQPAPAPRPGDRLKRTSFGASIFDGRLAMALDLYGKSINARDDYSYYKLFQGRRENGPTSLKAVEEIDIGNLRYLAALDGAGKVFSYNFPEGEWHPASQALNGAAEFVTLTPSGQSGLFVVSANGSITPFDLRSRRFGSALTERWPQNVSAFARLGTKLVTLRADGKVVDSSGAPISGLEGNYTDLVNVPLYDAFEVAP